MSLKHAENVVPRRYTAEQLGRLMEIVSAVKCECPNHVAKIVTGLDQFEDYERSCLNGSEKDREVHETLYRLTVQARQVMEQALALVIEADGLTL
jgi:hypothetical protein